MTIQLYNLELSGNCHKVRLMLSFLQLEYEVIPVDLFKGEHKTPDFLQLNPFGQIPVLRDGDAVIRDSQAILVYLARRYGGESWFPADALSMSEVVQWLSIAANEIQQSFFAARLYFLFNFPTDIELAQRKADQLLQVLNPHLEKNDWLALNRRTIADLACFPYIGLAADGKISLAAYPRVEAWIDRIKHLPGYISMPGL